MLRTLPLSYAQDFGFISSTHTLCCATLCFVTWCFTILRQVVFHMSSGPCSDPRLWGVVIPLSFADSSGSCLPSFPSWHAAPCRSVHAMPCLGLASAMVLLTTPCSDQCPWDVDGLVGFSGCCCCCSSLRDVALSSVGCSTSYGCDMVCFATLYCATQFCVARFCVAHFCAAP